MELVLDQNSIVGEFVARRIPGVKTVKNWGKFTAIGFKKGGELVAGAVFTAFTGHDVVISLAASDPRWATKEILGYLSKLVFEDWGCETMTAITSRRAKHARQFIERNGFRRWGVKPKGYDGKQDAVYYVLLKEECKWL